MRRETTLGQACEIIMGTSPPGDTYNTTGEGEPLVNGPVEFSDGSFGKTIRSKFTTAPSKRCKEGDLIVCVRGSTTGRMNIAAFDACIGRGVAAIRAKEYQPFINYFVRSKRQNIYDLGTGATFPNISSDALRDLKLSLPPLPEQQRIVGILDEAFAGIATAKATAEKNLRNASALFESQLDALFTDRTNGWSESKLGDVCGFVGGSQPPKSVFEKKSNANNVRLIQIRDYKSDKHLVYIPRALAKRFCKADDVMIGRYGPPLFQILRGLEGAYNVALMKTVPDESKVTRDFLFYFLKHTTILQYIIFHSARTAGQTGITKETLEPYPIALPSLGEQQRVVAKLQSLDGECSRLQSLYQQKLTALDGLKKSLLHRAFSGQITSTKSHPKDANDRSLLSVHSLSR